MKRKNQVYFKLGLTLLCVILASIVFMVILNNLPGFFNVISSFFRIISPLLFGVLFAYLMNPIMKFVERNLLRLIERWGKPEKVSDPAWMRSRRKICHVVGVILALATLLGVFYLAIALVVPTIVENAASLFTADNAVVFFARVKNWINQLFSDRPQIQEWANQKVSELYGHAVSWLTNLDLRDALTSLISQIYGVVKGTLNFLLGLVISVYMLLSKEKFLGQMKKMIVALFSEKHANSLLEFGRRTNKIFSGFVLGKIIDSIIIGIICYILMSILSLPYPMLISVIVGVTNIIPFFGPLIGAIPSAILILLINPLQCLIFIIMVVLLQQFDGNILGPRILGDSVGLSSFWILIAITLFSGLFDIIGMIIGVPVFAVLYMLVSEFVHHRLQKKNRPLETEAYERIKSTDDIPPVNWNQTLPEGPLFGDLVDDLESGIREVPDYEEPSEELSPLGESEIEALLQLLDDSQ